MYNLFIISTPSQAMNAIAAIKYFDIVDYKIIVKNISDEIKDRIVFILDQFNICNYEKIKSKKFSDLLNYYFKIKIKSKENKVYRIFIGDFEDISHRVITSVNMNKKTEAVFYDDGNNTILAYETGFYFTQVRKKKTISWSFKYFICNLLANHNKLLRNSKVFSMYPPHKEIKSEYIENNMNYLRDLTIPEEQMAGIYIVGSPVVEINLYKSNEYTKTIQSIIYRNKDEQTYYVPHRKEKRDKFDNLISQGHIKWVENKTIIELFFIESKKYPKEVYGFGSSALYTIKKMYPNTKIFNLGFLYDSDILSKEQVDEYRIIEDYYITHGIQNIELS